MTQGKVIHYNRNEGTGIVSLEGQQYPFSIVQWRGDCAPELNMVVEFVLDGTGVLETVSPVLPAPVVAAAPTVPAGCSGRELAGKAVAHGKVLADQLVCTAGMLPLLCYGVFVIAALLGGAISVGMLGLKISGSLYSVLGESGLSGLVWISGLSVILPCVWHDRRAWLASLLPLATVVLTLLSLYSKYAEMRDTLGGVNQLVGSLGGPQLASRGFFELVSTGPAFYLAAAASCGLLLLGWRRFQRA